MNRFYIVVEGGSPTITVAGSGWQLEAATLDYRYVDGMHSGLASVYAVQQGAEVFESAHLPGGADGSITVGAAPCSNAVAGTGGEPAGVGAGKVRLTGGRTSPTLFCPTLRDPDLASWAVGATQWKLEGRMVGNSTLNEVRLLVIDLPPSGAGSLASDPLAP